MQEFFSRLEQVLRVTNISQKHKVFLDLYDDVVSHKLVFQHNEEIARITPHTIATIKPPHHIKQSRLDSPAGIARTLHAIAHIEYSAITLALDSAYRFRYLPYTYYTDWIQVAKEEFEHFFLLENLLHELGSKYGDFAVHSGLYDAMLRTDTSFLYRMGVVHRGLEARGLDANPFVLQKFQALQHPLSSKIEEILQLILRDEIGHVSRGDLWWRFAIDSVHSAQTPTKNLQNNLQAKTLQDVKELMSHIHDSDLKVIEPLWCGLDSSSISKVAEAQDDRLDYGQIFLALCIKFADLSLCGKIPNTQARLRSGFSEYEIKQLDQLYALRAHKILADRAKYC